MNGISGNIRVFFGSPPFLKYLVSAVFLLSALITSILRLSWYYQGLAWFLAIILSIAIFKTYVKFSLLPDGLDIKTRLSGFYRYSFTSMFIPRGNLLGISGLSPTQTGEYGLFYKDEGGIIRYIIPPWGKKGLESFKKALQSEYPEMACPDNLKDLVFGDKVKEINRMGLPWKGKMIEGFLTLGFLITFLATLPLIFGSFGLTLKEGIIWALVHGPLNVKFIVTGFILFIPLFVFFNIKEILGRRNNREVILVIYEKGLLLKADVLLQDKFISWDKISDIKLSRIHPALIIDVIQPNNKKYQVTVEGYVNETDFQEIKNYIDINRNS